MGKEGFNSPDTMKLRSRGKLAGQFKKRKANNFRDYCFMVKKKDREKKQRERFINND